MRIGFDAKRAFMNSSGLGNYSRTLISSLMENFPGNDYFAFTPGITGNLGKDLVADKKLKIILPPQLMRTFLSSWWRSSMVSEDIRAQNLDVYHGLSNELPKRIPYSTRKIVTIHDLIFLRHPEWYPFIDRNTYYKKFRYACKQADAVVAVSRQTKDDIMYYFNTSEDKIYVIYQGCDKRFSQQVDDTSIEMFRRNKNLPEKYILYVGTIEERKNLLVLVQAMSGLNDVRLVVIGKKKKYFEKVNAFINSNNLRDKILFPADVSSEELPLLYKCATAFIHPGFYEGFGIPILEALCSGIPVIASASSALPEAGGPSSIYFNPNDPAELAEKLKKVLGDRELREKMIRGGILYSGGFSQEKTAGQMMELYNKIAG